MKKVAAQAHSYAIDDGVLYFIDPNRSPSKDVMSLSNYGHS